MVSLSLYLSLSLVLSIDGWSHVFYFICLLLLFRSSCVVCDLRTISFKMGDMYKRVLHIFNVCLSLWLCMKKEFLIWKSYHKVWTKSKVFVCDYGYDWKWPDVRWNLQFYDVYFSLWIKSIYVCVWERKEGGIT